MNIKVRSLAYLYFRVVLGAGRQAGQTIDMQGKAQNTQQQENNKQKRNGITLQLGCHNKTVLLDPNYNQILMQMNSVIKGAMSAPGHVQGIFPEAIN